MQQCDMILDCTRQDVVLRHLEAFSWQGTKLFVSLSLGFRARRLFCFTMSRNSFPHSDFRELLHPWLEREREDYADEQLPREGIACWHPVFPARFDDVAMMASAAMKYLESLMARPPLVSTLTVFEQQYEQDTFVGVRKVATEDVHGR